MAFQVSKREFQNIGPLTWACPWKLYPLFACMDGYILIDLDKSVVHSCMKYIVIMGL